jgi:anti-sigma factor ChrR (cupin superfamily)
MDVLGPGLSVDELRARARDPELAWTAFGPGIDIHLLWGDLDAASAALLRYAPGAQGPRHRHEGVERVYVLAGAQRDERGVYPEGVEIVNQPGTIHRVSSPEGCIVAVVWERPNTFFHDEPPR